MCPTQGASIGYTTEDGAEAAMASLHRADPRHRSDDAPREGDSLRLQGKRRNADGVHKRRVSRLTSAITAQRGLDLRPYTVRFNGMVRAPLPAAGRNGAADPWRRARLMATEAESNDQHHARGGSKPGRIRPHAGRRAVLRRIWYDHGLTVVLLGLFVFSMVGQTLSGWRVFNEEQHEHGEGEVSLGAYLRTGHFGEATFENWESEFLQMAFYVLLTVVLYQKGSSESKRPDVARAGRPAIRASPRDAGARRGRCGEADSCWCSTSTRSASRSPLLFVASFALHASTGVREFNQEQVAHGETAVSVLGVPRDRRSSGSSRSRTGRASSCRWSRWSCCRSSCASADRPSPSRWTHRPGTRGTRVGQLLRNGSDSGARSQELGRQSWSRVDAPAARSD